MITRKYYLIQAVNRLNHKDSMWLHKSNRVFKWHNHGEDKEYKNLSSAVKRAVSIGPSITNNYSINVVEVTFKPCTPELPDGYYEPVNRVVHTFN